ncbi:hypothetical protein G4G27_09820 [Sphingomonas sp. So64.6b]|uniref:hypothetical protein n=1 Tax=Sphingomonas sp. So64.6b TaxID=2997354 RepID=UPI0016010D15|nr:hypothetical protein [Sphingomonas sp. So64.6b]QNA84250.1 hypothetical protein G4G27_09820 [Sphingomonas sp. So64.6b]
MRILQVPLFLLAGICAAGSATAEQSGGSASAKPAKEKKICRPIVGTGTILSRSFCLSKAEWEEFDARNEADVETVRRSRGSGMDRYPAK